MLSGYLVLPFFTWLITGSTKFLVNCIREKRLAFDLIGYGGMPSNHSAIVSAMAAYIAFKEGIYQPAFGVALTLAFIVMLDANSLRLKIGEHAKRINKICDEESALRERVGHTKPEILAGILVGVTSAYVLLLLDSYL